MNTETGEPVNVGNEPTLEHEMQMLIHANQINDLLPQFIRKQTWQHPKTGKTHEMIVIERLYPLPKNHFDLKTRTIMVEIFKQKMQELHKAYFVHGDLMRPTRYYNRNDMEWIFENIIQTEQGLRLIDTGFSRKINWEESEEKCRNILYIRHDEQEEVKAFEEYYLSL